MSPSRPLFFVALLPPPAIREQVTAIKQDFAARYDSRHALKSPPHVTLQPPFKWLAEDMATLENALSQFTTTRQPVPVTLSGFGAFPPRVIYVNVLKTPELLDIQKQLSAHFEDTLNLVDERSKKRAFSPHMTVAFKDLTRQNFRAAWPEFGGRAIGFEFEAKTLTLLRHDGRRWEIHRDFPLAKGD